MRLMVMGQQAFGKAALEKLIEAGRDEVVAVYCAPDREGRPLDPLKEVALDLGIPVRQPSGFRNRATLDEMREFGCDLMIMAYVTIFVPEAARESPRLGSICFHPSLLPKHRGPSSINWPIIQGATGTGFSWFHPTDGLDEGDILLQHHCPIGPDDTLGDVYFRKIFPAAIESVLEVCDLFRSGNPPRIAQNDSQASYEGWCKAADARIDWSRHVDDVYNLVRGTNPQPGAWTEFRGQRLQIYDARKSAGEGSPGTVAGMTDDSVVVQAGSGRIDVRRVRPAGKGKIAAVDWAREAGIGPGDQLGVQ